MLFGPSIKEENTLDGLMLFLFPALLCFVGSSLSKSVEEMFCSDCGAIETFSSSFLSNPLSDDNIMSW